LKLTDFGIAREWIPNTDNSNETSGTPGYMAPEVMCKNNHGIAADYFAVGVIAWECMFGRRPYQGKSRKEIRDAILAKQAHIRKNEVPENWDIEAADFINKVGTQSQTFFLTSIFFHIFTVSITESIQQARFQRQRGGEGAPMV
jgi:serine/threonine protein kinase